jgi:hypothetical protein
MRMNITILGRQSDMSWKDQQRTRRCLKVIQDIGFDIKIAFTEASEGELYEFSRPAMDGEYSPTHLGHKILLSKHYMKHFNYGDTP